MLRMIPRYPFKITATQIAGRLSGEGFTTSKRTIERDLHELSRTFPLMLDARTKPFGWSWQKDAPAFDLPGLGEHEALMLMMVERHLKSLLPHATLDVLAPYIKAAAKRLDAGTDQGNPSGWVDKVHVVPASQPLMSPGIDTSIHRAVTAALLHEHQLKIHYRKRGSDADVEYRIHPLAMVQRGAVFYLCVRISDYEDVRLLAVHRISDAEILDAKSERPANFSLEKVIADGMLDFGQGESVSLLLAFSESAGQHLFETPLSPDQAITQMPDGRMQVAATLPDTPQLFWWLLAFGDGVEILEPAHLRDKMIATLNNLRTRYRMN